MKLNTNKGDLLDVATGNTGHVSTLNVLISAREGKRALRQSRVTWADADLSDEHYERTSELLEQVGSLEKAVEAATDPAIMAHYTKQIEQLLDQIEEDNQSFAIKSATLRKEAGATPLELLSDALFVPVQMIMRTALNIVLLIIFWGVLIGSLVFLAEVMF